jgi:hypothetical protein
MTEQDFWESTIGELERLFSSKRRMEKQRAQERATFDYNLADLIGRSVARVYNSSNHMPEISEVYPTLFDSEQIQRSKQEKKAELSALRFKQFAESFNRNFTEEGKEVE